MDGTTEVLLPPAPHAAGDARRHLQRVGRTWPEDVLDVALLLTSELVTNAVRYGAGRVCLNVHALPEGAAVPGRVRVEVCDANPAPVPPGERPAPGAESGRGLHIVDTLATRWGTTSRPDPPGKCVWFELETGTRASG